MGVNYKAIDIKSAFCRLPLKVINPLVIADILNPSAAAGVDGSQSRSQVPNPKWIRFFTRVRLATLFHRWSLRTVNR